ncbi:hypothetical protein KIL84_020671, partial [Mauremys mutica]
MAPEPPDSSLPGLFLSCPQNVTLRFNALLNSTSLWDGGDNWEVGSAVTVLLQSVELAALATTLRSPERTTQNVTTESLAIQTQLVRGNCSQHSEVFTLRAHEETMDVHCDTVTGAATQGITEDCNKHITCPLNTKCVNNTHCTCLDGFQPSGNRVFTNLKETCNDIDECLGLMVCGNFTKCHNFPGSYYCSCSDGFESEPGKENFIPASESTCRDVNECLRSPDICGPGAQCENTNGSHQCACPTGYIPSTGSWVQNQTTCKAPSINCSSEFEGIKETCRNFSLP